MVHLDSDLLGILLALLTFIVPAVTSAIEAKKKKARQQQEAVQDEQVVPEADASEELEEMFNILLGKQKEEWEQEPDDVWAPEVAKVDQVPEVAEIVQHQQHQQQSTEEPEEKVTFTEGTSAVAKAYQPSVEPAAGIEPEDTGHAEMSLKEKFRSNPKDALVMGEILKPKFKEY